MNCAIHTQTPAVAFCRTCGKALCEECKRDVMGAIYCEPCIAARLQGTGAAGAAPPPPGMTGLPNPGVAAWLGMIPGVGAMYNGQFVKALIHLAIFVLLIVATTHISGLIGLFIGFFVIYMAFEAYQTANARHVGASAPDPLGLDHLFGVHEDRPPVRPVNPATAATPARTASPEHAPTGAVILIGLGILFLLDTLGKVHFHRLWPLFLIGLGLWIAYKRTSHHGA